MIISENFVDGIKTSVVLSETKKKKCNKTYFRQQFYKLLKNFMHSTHAAEIKFSKHLSLKFVKKICI